MAKGTVRLPKTLVLTWRLFIAVGQEESGVAGRAHTLVPSAGWGCLLAVLERRDLMSWQCMRICARAAGQMPGH